MVSKPPRTMCICFKWIPRSVKVLVNTGTFITFSDPYVKVTLATGLKTFKTRKTSVKKNTIDPVFNESLSFNLPQESGIDNCSLVITVWDYNSKSRDDLVGRVFLGKYATGAYEITHWNRMLQCQRSPIAQWHTLRTRKQCDELSSVSAAVNWGDNKLLNKTAALMRGFFGAQEEFMFCNLLVYKMNLTNAWRLCAVGLGRSEHGLSFCTAICRDVIIWPCKRLCWVGVEHLSGCKTLKVRWKREKGKLKTT